MQKIFVERKYLKKIHIFLESVNHFDAILKTACRQGIKKPAR